MTAIFILLKHVNKLFVHVDAMITQISYWNVLSGNHKLIAGIVYDYEA